MVVAYSNFSIDKFKSLKFCIFNSSKLNKIELKGIKNNLYNKYKFDCDDFKLFGDAKYEDATIKCTKLITD